jgi:two-component system cell cycle sensor histidine kinase/response regulator CckA
VGPVTAAPNGRKVRPIRSFVPWFVLGLSTALSLVAAYYAHLTAEGKDRLRFQSLVQKARDTIESRMETHVALLRATSGLFSASEFVSRHEFRAFVLEMDLPESYPGVRGIGYTRRVPATEDERVIAELRREVPGFSIWSGSRGAGAEGGPSGAPAGASADAPPAAANGDAFPVVYLEPLGDSHRAVIGFDMATERGRREAMEAARDSGQPAASGVLTLIGEAGAGMESVDSRGFLVYQPIYRHEMAVSTRDERRAALEGFVFSPYLARDLAAGITSAAPTVAFRVYAAAEEKPGDLLLATGGDGPFLSRFSTIAGFKVAGHLWILSCAARPSFLPQRRGTQTLAILFGGLSIGVILFALSRAQARARADAESVAEDLRRSEEQYRQLIDLAPEATFIQTGGRFAFVNSAMAALLGAPDAQAVLGLPVLDRIHPDVRAIVLSRMEEMRREKRSVPLIEERWIRLDGSTVDVEVAASPCTYEGREGAQVVLRDVTERKSLEGQLRQSQKMEAIGRLAGGVAHDFNNILTAIAGYSEILQARLEQDPSLSAYATEIIRAAERASSLTRQLLAFSRKEMMDPRVMELNAVVSDMDRMLRRLIGEDIELVTMLHPNLSRVRADPGQVEQILMNLVLNARDAMPRGGRLVIETRNIGIYEGQAIGLPEAGAGGWVELSVADTGIGMDRETQSRLFEPFFTTKEVGKGTGLGLSTVYGIVRRSGGQVTVWSEPGRGATFRVYLPAVDDPAERPATSGGDSAAASGSETVLVVEDEASVRSFIREVLGGRGYALLEARNADEAVAIFERHSEPIHLLVSDVVMPGMGGPELAERLAGVHPETRVLFISGYAREGLFHDGRPGADAAFLAKPFSPEALARAVREILDGGSGPDGARSKDHAHPRV